MNGPEAGRIENVDTPDHILLMEDDAAVARGLNMILREEGYEVDLAATGREALDTAGKKKFDLLVADLRLPDMDGMDVVKRIRETRPNTKVIVITGYANVHTAVEAMKTGAFDYLAKPFTEEEFMTRINKALRRGADRAEIDLIEGVAGEPEDTGVPGPKALVVEDDRSVSEGLVMILKENGFDAGRAVDGRTAMNMIASETFDVLVVDLRLPDTSGMSVIRHAGKHCPDTPVIVITGRAGVSSAVDAMRMGVADYLAKPFTEEDFLGTVGRALRKRQDDHAPERFVRRLTEEAASIRMGFYICHGGADIAGPIDVKAVVAFAGRRPEVVVARDCPYLCREAGLTMIRNDIEKLNLNRVVVAACAPDSYEKVFQDACVRAGLKPGRCLVAPVREQVAWVARDSAEAMARTRNLVAAAIHRVEYLNIHPPRRVPVNPAVLVVGGGIAGMRAALDVARAGNRVHLVEKASTIGGHMLQFDKTFPTLDCAACIGTPVMVEVAQQPNIDLLTCSEVTEISGHVGNYTVTVRKNPRYVDADKCTGCGECEKVCPVSRPSEWDAGLRQRRAIYRSFPQATPAAFAIDKRGVTPCKAACPAHVAIQGFVVLIKQGKYKEALALFRRDHPFPGVCGRVCHHPCENECSRGEQDAPLSIRELHRFLFDREMDCGESGLPETMTEKRTEKVAVIGSGPAGLAAGYFLAGKGYGVTVFEKLPLPGGWMAVGIPEYRLPRDILHREIETIRNLGVEIRTGVTFGRDVTFDTLRADGYAAVFMAIGLHAGRRLGIENEDADGVLQGGDLLRRIALGEDVGIVGRRAVVIGGGNAALDCARTLTRLGSEKVYLMYRRARGDMPAHEQEIVEAEQEGIELICPAAPRRIIIDARGRVTGLDYLRMKPGGPDESGRPRPLPIEGSETVLYIDTVIPAVGQCADTADIDEIGLAMTKQGTFRADPVTLQTPLKWVFAGGDAVYGPGSVVEAVASGKKAAENIDRFLNGLDLRQGQERRWHPARPDNRTGMIETAGIRQRERVEVACLNPEERTGNFNEINRGLNEEMAGQEAARCLECGICSECRQCVTVCQPGAIDHDMQPEERKITVGSVILATGFDLMDPEPLRRYGYGKHPNVFTSMEFERLNNATGPTGGRILMRNERGEFARQPRSVALIHCVGSRDVGYHEYCSRVCCMYALKYAHLIKEKAGPDTKVYQFYIDMRCFGKGYEEFYRRCQEEGVLFIRGKPAEVVPGEADCPEEVDRLVVVGEDTLLNRLCRVPVDMVVLCAAMEPRRDAGDVAKLFGVGIGPDGFFMEAQNKVAPLNTTTPGIFLAGTCQAPRDIIDTVAQASGAAARALELAMRGSVEIPYTIAWIDPEACGGCRICIRLCPDQAIAFDEYRGISLVNPDLCGGCGVCVGACPEGAAHIWRFREKRIFTEMDDIGEGFLAVNG